MAHINTVLAKYVVTSSVTIKSLDYNQGDWGVSGSLDFIVRTKFGTVTYSGNINGEEDHYHSYLSIDVNDTGNVIELNENDLTKHHPGGTNNTLDNIVLCILDVIEKKFVSWPYSENDLAEIYEDDGFDTDEAERMAQDDINRAENMLLIYKRDARRNLIRALNRAENIYDQNPNDIDGIYS